MSKRLTTLGVALALLAGIGLTATLSSAFAADKAAKPCSCCKVCHCDKPCSCGH